MTQGRLTFLLDTDDLRVVERQCPQALRDTVVAMDVEVYLALRDAGLSPITPWDVVQHDDKSELDTWHDDIWRFWLEHARIDYQGVDLLAMARFRHMACFARMAWISFVVHRCLLRFQPDEVVTFDEPSGHGLEQPAHYRKMPVLFAIVRGMAEQAGVPVRLLTRDDGADTAFVDHAAVSGAQRLPPVHPDRVLGDTPYVLFAGSGIDLLRQLPLIEEIQTQCDCKVIQLYKSADDTTLGKMHRLGYEIWHESQLLTVAEDNHDPAIAKTTMTARTARERLLHRAPTTNDATRAIYQNDYLHIHFDFIFGAYAVRMATHVDRFSVFLRRTPPAMIVANHPEPIVEVAVRMGIPTLLLPHGVMSTVDERWYGSFPPAYIGAVGEAQRAFLSRIGVPKERIVLTGDPGFEDVLSRYHSLCSEPRTSVRADPPGETYTRGTGFRRTRTHFARKTHQAATGIKPAQKSTPTNHQDDGRFRILLATGPLGRLAHASELPTVDWKHAVETVHEIAELARRRTEWQWIIKPHPRYDHAALYDQVFGESSLRETVTIADDESLADCLAAVDVVVFVNTRSSGIVEASFSGRPVLILICSMPWLDMAQWGMDRWPVVQSVGALEAEMDRLAKSIASGHYARRTHQTKEAALAFFGTRPTSSLSACSEFILQTLACPTGN